MQFMTFTDDRKLTCCHSVRLRRVVSYVQRAVEFLSKCLQKWNQSLDVWALHSFSVINQMNHTQRAKGNHPLLTLMQGKVYLN